MRLPSPLLDPRRRLLAFKRHIQITKDAGAQVFETVASVMGVFGAGAPVDDELVVAIYGVVELL